MENQLQFSTGETAELLGITAKTLRAWGKEGKLVPDVLDYTSDKVNGERKYSKKQIEEYTGKTVAELNDPILLFSSPEKIQDTKKKCSVVWNFDYEKDLEGKTLKEKYNSFYCKLIQYSSYLYRQNEYAPPNYIFTSPEVSAIFETSTAGFAPASWNPPEFIGRQKVIRVGMVSGRWKLYSSYLMPMNEIIFGYVEKGRLYEGPNFVTHITIDNLTVFY